jgi:hypothetical protein
MFTNKVMMRSLNEDEVRCLSDFGVNFPCPDFYDEIFNFHWKIVVFFRFLTGFE